MKRSHLPPLSLLLSAVFLMPACQSDKDTTPPLSGKPTKAWNVLVASINDGEGRQLQHIIYDTQSFDTAGDDGVYLTGDDHVSLYSRILYQDGSGEQRNVFYSHPGADQRWFSEDDVIERYSEIRHPDGLSSRYVQYVDAGVNGHWFDEDDSVSQYSLEAPLDDERQRKVLYKAAGGDGEWFTADDVVERYSISYRWNGDVVENYKAAGDDGRWFTDDDVADVATHRQVLSEQNETIYRRVHPGADGRIQINTDPTVEEKIITTYQQGDAEITETISYTIALNYNADTSQYESGEWQVDSANRSESHNGRVTRVTYYSANGGDGRWFTADDDISSIVTYEAREDKNNDYTLYRQRTHTATGPDGRWRTQDDIIQEGHTFLEAIRSAGATL